MKTLFGEIIGKGKAGGNTLPIEFLAAEDEEEVTYTVSSDIKDDLVPHLTDLPAKPVKCRIRIQNNQVTNFRVE